MQAASAVSKKVYKIVRLEGGYVQVPTLVKPKLTYPYSPVYGVSCRESKEPLVRIPAF